jgi:hypothetical protein
MQAFHVLAQTFLVHKSEKSRAGKELMLHLLLPWLLAGCCVEMPVQQGVRSGVLLTLNQDQSTVILVTQLAPLYRC